MSATIKLLTYPKILEGAVRDFAVNYTNFWLQISSFSYHCWNEDPIAKLEASFRNSAFPKTQQKNRFTLTPHSSIMLLLMAYVSDNIYIYIYSSASSTHPPFNMQQLHWYIHPYILNPSTIENTKLQKDLLHTKTSQCLFAQLDFMKPCRSTFWDHRIFLQIL